MPERGGNKDIMSVIRILHAADLHLDSPFEGLPDAKASQRRAEQRRLLERIAAAANSQDVKLVLLSGDLLDTGSAYMETAESLIAALSSIGAPVFIAPGNHDWYSDRSPYARLQWPDNVHIFKYPHIECVPLPELGVRVWGAGFADARCQSMLDGFEAEKEEGTLDIMCIHGDAVMKDSPYNPITEDEIARSGMDYIALGHIHKASGLKRAGDTYYAWPGCPEGRGFDERGEKYIYITDVSEGKCSVRPVSVALRRYEILPVDLSDGGDVESKLPENTDNDIYRLVLTGETESAPDIPALRRALEGRFFALDIRDETRLRRDVWDRAGDDTLRGVFLKNLRAMYDAADTEEEKIRVARAARWGLAALDNREEVSRSEDK